MADTKVSPKTNPSGGNKTQNPKQNKKKGPANNNNNNNNKPQEDSAPVAATEAPSNNAVATTQTTAPLSTSDNAQTTKEKQELRGVVVSNLPIEFSTEELRELGAPYGRIVAVRLLKPDWNSNTRAGYIQYNSTEDAGYAAYILYGKILRGKINLVAELRNMSKEAPAKKKVEEVKPTKDKKKKEQMSLRFLSPMNPATETAVANQNQPQIQNFAAAPPPVENWTNYPPDTGAPAVNLPEAPSQQPTRQSGKNRRPPQQSPPSLREDDDQDYNLQEGADSGWSQSRTNNRNSGNNTNTNSNGGRRGGRGGRGRRGGRGGRRNAEYVPAGEYRDDQYQQDAQQGSSTTYPQQQQQQQKNQNQNQKQFKVKQPQSDLPGESSPVAPNEPQTQNQSQQGQPKKNNQKRPNNNYNNKPKSPQQQQSNPQSPAPIVDEYEVILTHLKTKDPKIKFRIPAEQQPNFMKAIEAWLPAN